MSSKKKNAEVTPAEETPTVAALPQPTVDHSQADEITVAGPDGKQFNCPRPPCPVGATEGFQFNRTVRNPVTRASHAQRFVVVNGKAEPVAK